MKFKDTTVEAQFSHSPLLLKLMVEEFERYSIANYGIEPILTRVLEHIAGDSGIHEQNRAVDIRQEHPTATFMYSAEQQASLLLHINQKFYRNDGKPSMICHVFNDSPLHFHLQISNFNSVYVA